jgi:subtilisin family serine protease
VEYTAQDIDSALTAPEPINVVRHKDRRDAAGMFHGTHVAGIAAGNGRPAPPDKGQPVYVGIAPQARIVVVANSRGRLGNEHGLSDSADTIDALRYVADVAAALSESESRLIPCVINLSQGDNIGPHDGTSLLEMAIGNLVAAPGLVFVKSAGNEAARARHAVGTLEAGAKQTVMFDVPMSAATQIMVDIWYPHAGRIAVRVEPPGGGAGTDDVSTDQTATFKLSNGNEVFIDSELDNPGNHDNRIVIVITPGTKKKIAGGLWTLALSVNGSVTGEWHAWIQTADNVRFQAPHVSADCTLTTPGTHPAVISVGAYVTRGSSNGDIAKFSSRGPTRDGRRAPTISAPGEITIAPQPESDVGFFAGMRGTSMAAPVIAGAVALLLEKRPTATLDVLKLSLESTARADAATGNTPNNVWGAGKLDAAQAYSSLDD